MKMNNRIDNLQESPCYLCNCDKQCNKKIQSNIKLKEIKDQIFGNKNFDYHECGIWIALNAPEMIEVDE